MIFKVIYSTDAQRNLHEIRAYIHDVLREPQTAQKQLRRIIKAVRGLDQLPFRHRTYEHEPWRSLGFRSFPVDNYLIIYLPNEDAQTVTVAHIIYGARDIPAQLEETE